MYRIASVMVKALLFPILLTAQTADKKEPAVKSHTDMNDMTINVDYVSGKFPSYRSVVPKGTNVTIIIDNINLKLVAVGEKVNKQNFNETPPKIFESFSNVTLPDVTQTSAAMAAVGTKLLDPALIAEVDVKSQGMLNDLELKYKEVNKQLNDRLSRLKVYRDLVSRMKFLSRYQYDLLKKQDLCNTSFDNIVDQVNVLTKTYFMDARMGLNSEDKAILITTSNYSSNGDVLSRHIGDLISKEEDAYIQLIKLFAPGSIGTVETQIKSLTEEAVKLSDAWKNDKKANIQAVASSLEVNERIAELEPTLQDAKYLFELLDVPKVHADFTAFAATGSDDLKKTYNYFNRGNFTYIKPLGEIEGDVVDVELDVVRKENAPCPAIPGLYKFRFRPKGKFKMDFSTGLFLNLGGNNFKDQSYRYEDVENDPDKSVILKNKSKNAVFPSVGALMHIYWTNGKQIQPAIAFGISTKDLDRINYHLGGSLIFGYSQRFILTAGGTLTRATLIDDKYEVGQEVPRIDAATAVPTSNFNRFGFFFSLTYNFVSK